MFTSASAPPTVAEPVANRPTIVMIANPIAFQTIAFTTDLRRVSIPNPVFSYSKRYIRTPALKILNMINKIHQS